MNSRIARICANIDYVIPKGTLKEYKYGVRVNRPSATNDTPAQLLGPETIEADFEELKHEMMKPIRSSSKPPEPEIIK